MSYMSYITYFRMPGSSGGYSSRHGGRGTSVNLSED